MSSIKIWALMVLLTINFCAGKQDEKIEKIVKNALDQAIKNLEKRTTVTKPKQTDASPPGGSQKANEESRQLQKTADVYEEATKILVAEYGTGILEPANEIIQQTEISENLSENIPEAMKTLTKLKVFPFSGNGNFEKANKLESLCKGPTTNCLDKIHNQIRSITGLCNNRHNKFMGNSVTPVRRLLGAALYTDGLGAMRNQSVTGSPLPSARLISNQLHVEDPNSGKPRFSPHTNHFLMQIGQFVAHDIIFMPSSETLNGETLDCSDCDSATTVSSNCAPIDVPQHDPYFKEKCMKFTRALNGQTGFGVRTQIDQNTHFLDLSAVYGSSDCEARTVRSFINGKLATYTGMGYDLPPQDLNTKVCQSKAPTYCFIAGDFRNSLHPALIPVHTIFIKEHNRLATKVKQARPGMSDEQIYQLVRKILIGQWQHVIYSEYLPKVLPNRYLKNFDLKPLSSGFFMNYDKNKNPSLSAEFAAAAFRFGHSTVRSDFPRQNINNQSAGNYDLGYNIFYADQLYLRNIGGWEPMLMGLVKTAGMIADRHFSFPIRNQIFETRKNNGSGIDLVSINIMRGRDIGLFPYINYREIVGLSKVTNWKDLTSTFTKENLELLKSVYAKPNDIDLYTGLMMERRMAGGQLGPTASFMIADQFHSLKVGDRFFYENRVKSTENFSKEQLDQIRRASLSKLICENTEILKNVPKDIFSLDSESVACSSLFDIDINIFLPNR